MEWKRSVLNMTGRVVLAKASLSGIPFHVMSYIKIPGKVTKAIDKTIRDFIWGSTREKRKCILLARTPSPKTKIIVG